MGRRELEREREREREREKETEKRARGRKDNKNSEGKPNKEKIGGQNNEERTLKMTWKTNESNDCVDTNR
jgi:hypothetical protein